MQSILRRKGRKNERSREDVGVWDNFDSCRTGYLLSGQGRKEGQMKDLSKRKMQLSEALQILGALKVPSTMINSTDIADAIRYGMMALEKQIDIGQTIEELKDNPDDADVLDYLNYFYLMSEVNR